MCMLRCTSLKRYEPKVRGKWCCNAITFGIQIPTNFHGVTRKSFTDIVIFGWFHKESVLPFGFANTFDPNLVWINKNVRSRVHELPHPSVNGNFRFLYWKEWTKMDEWLRLKGMMMKMKLKKSERKNQHHQKTIQSFLFNVKNVSCDP